LAGRSVPELENGDLDVLRHSRSTRTALYLREVLLYDEWQQIGERLLTVANSSAWWIGDWLLFGQRTYPDRYAIAVERTGFDYQTLRNYAWVASRFDPARRHETLSFSHHAEVAALAEEEQDDWLRRAWVNGWSRNALRRQLRIERAGAGRTAPTSAIRLEVPEDRRALWEAAAEASGCDLDEWIAQNLDRAAASTLGTRVAAAA
jgi:hypothetical protein